MCVVIVCLDANCSAVLLSGSIALNNKQWLGKIVSNAHLHFLSLSLPPSSHPLSPCNIVC